MKFVCERCHTRYSIADDKVRQKILKIRCKTCENVITVRDPGASGIEAPVSAGNTQPPPAPAPARNPTPPPMAGAREWFVAVNGDQQGPLSRAEAAKHISQVQADDEVYVWKEGLDGWKPPHEVPPIQQELNALRSRTAAPPAPRPAPRPMAPTRGAAPAAAARQAPQAFGDEDHTQIQPFDAAMLAPDMMKPAPAPAPAAVLPFRGKSTNGAPAPAPVPAAASLDGLFSDLPPAAAPAAGGFVPAPASLHAPGRSDSSLSRLTGFAGFMSRNPGLKFVAGGAVVVVLLALAVIVLVRMPGDQKPPPPPMAAVEKAAPPTTLDILPGRPPDEKLPTTKNVPPVSHGPSMGPAKGSKGRATRGPQQKVSSVTPPAAGGLEPPPVAEAPAGPRTAAPGERVVPTYQPKRAPLPGAASGGPKEGVINAVVNKHENKVAITTCYERALKRDQKLRSGKMNVSLTVKPSGIPSDISITAPPEFASVEACIKQAVRRWMFPASNEEYQIEFPLIMAGNL